MLTNSPVFLCKQVDGSSKTDSCLNKVDFFRQFWKKGQWNLCLKISTLADGRGQSLPQVMGNVSEWKRASQVGKVNGLNLEQESSEAPLDK